MEKQFCSICHSQTNEDGSFEHKESCDLYPHVNVTVTYCFVCGEKKPKHKMWCNYHPASQQSSNQNVGWKCPDCGMVYSPQISYCDKHVLPTISATKGK